MSRGRGRGRGGISGFNREQLDYMGASNSGEQLPGPMTQPPPLYPLLESKPIPLNPTKDTNYMLLLKQDFLEHMQYKSTYVNLPQNQKDPELEMDILLAQLPKFQESCKFDWTLLPKELRSKLAAKRTKPKAKVMDLDTRLTQLEKQEENKTKVKTEVVEQEEEDEEAVMDEEQDEEMDEGTDYVNNYFDNGESYEDEDDNLDDGPIY